MCNESDGQKRLKGKRKFVNETDGQKEYFSPPKIPKITKYFNQFSTARLGIDPGEGPAGKRPGSSGKCPDGHL